MFSLCLSVHTRGGTPIPGSFPGLLVLGPFWGYSSPLLGGNPSPGPRGTPFLAGGTPGQRFPQPGLGYPPTRTRVPPAQDWGTPCSGVPPARAGVPPPGQVVLRAVHLIRFPTGGLSCDNYCYIHNFHFLHMLHC